MLITGPQIWTCKQMLIILKSLWHSPGPENLKDRNRWCTLLGTLHFYSHIRQSVMLEKYRHCLWTATELLTWNQSAEYLASTIYCMPSQCSACQFTSMAAFCGWSRLMIQCALIICIWPWNPGENWRWGGYIGRTTWTDFWLENTHFWWWHHPHSGMGKSHCAIHPYYWSIMKISIEQCAWEVGYWHNSWSGESIHKIWNSHVCIWLWRHKEEFLILFFTFNNVNNKWAPIGY